MATPPLTNNSCPTCGPTTSVRCSFTPASILPKISVIWAPIWSPFAFGSGGRRTRMSRELPNACTWAAATPAAASAERSASIFGACGKFVSTTTPPVKSTPKFKPRISTKASEATIKNADNPYHTLRVCMNGKRVTLWKNSMEAGPLDRQAIELALAAVNDLHQGMAAHHRGEYRGENSQHEHHGEAADRAGAEGPQHHAGDQGRHV